MKSFRRLSIPLLLATAFLAALPAAAAANDALWFHLEVRNGDGHGNLTVDLPMGLVQAVAALIPDRVEARGRIVVSDREIEPAELRRIWREVRNRPESHIATIEDHDGRLLVSKRRNELVFRAVDRDRERGEATFRLPITVVDALLSSPNPRRLDLGAAIDAFARIGGGELVTVADDRDTVRIWVDRKEGR